MPKYCRNPLVFDKIVTIQKPNYDVKDKLNKTDLENPGNWIQHCKAFCNCKTSTGRERFLAEQNHADVSHVWTTPSSPLVREITPDMQLIHNGVTHEIVYAIDEDEAQQHFIIATKAEPTYGG